MQYLHESRHQNTNMIQTYEDEIYDSSPIYVSYFSRVIRLVSVYPLPLVMRYRYTPLATSDLVIQMPYLPANPLRRADRPGLQHVTRYRSCLYDIPVPNGHVEIPEPLEGGAGDAAHLGGSLNEICVAVTPVGFL